MPEAQPAGRPDGAGQVPRPVQPLVPAPRWPRPPPRRRRSRSTRIPNAHTSWKPCRRSRHWSSSITANRAARTEVRAGRSALMRDAPVGGAMIVRAGGGMRVHEHQQQPVEEPGRQRRTAGRRPSRRRRSVARPAGAPPGTAGAPRRTSRRRPRAASRGRAAARPSSAASPIASASASTRAWPAAVEVANQRVDQPAARVAEGLPMGLGDDRPEVGAVPRATRRSDGGRRHSGGRSNPRRRPGRRRRPSGGSRRAARGRGARTGGARRAS